MYVLTDGKNYVMKNPMKEGDYIATTYVVKASEFTFKQARRLIMGKAGKKYSWMSRYYLLDQATGKVVNDKDMPEESNRGAFCDDNEFVFDENLPKEVTRNVERIIGMPKLDLETLDKQKNELLQGCSFYDSAISDIRHARMGKNPSDETSAKIDHMLNELVEKRRDIKEALRYVDVMLIALQEHWTITKMQEELEKVKEMPYKGRTKYFEMVNKILAE